MKTSDFYYDLDEKLIAQTPIEPRDHSRLLVFDRNTKIIEHKHFFDIENELTNNDVLVVNNTRVVGARLFGHKVNCTGKMEIFLLKRLNLTDYEVLAKPGRRLKVGAVVEFSDILSCEIINELKDGLKEARFTVKSGTMENAIDNIGQIPLPPYIKKQLENKERYQTVYSKIKGSSAAPTAGLHFTQDLLDRLKNKGVKIIEVLLQVGLGTFRPVSEDNLEAHVMHSEYVELSPETAKQLNEAKKQGKRIVAVGTTTVRVLETATLENGEVTPVKKDTNIFIYPGYKFKCVDALITNFHLPCSSLLMLVSAFATREDMLNVYNTAVKEKYRFFSFGDAMFIK